MSPANVMEPTYEAIKRRLKFGAWRSGTRLESSRIADELGVSVTPVRDCLYRLAGERMVDFGYGEGFHVHRLTETEMRDILELNLILLLAALATARGSPAEVTPVTDDLADRTAAIFASAARRSGNAELAAAIASFNDRLHLARRLDAEILDGTGQELDTLEDAFAGDQVGGDARNVLLRYHERRAYQAGVYVQRLSQTTP